MGWFLASTRLTPNSLEGGVGAEVCRPTFALPRVLQQSSCSPKALFAESFPEDLLTEVLLLQSVLDRRICRGRSFGLLFALLWSCWICYIACVGAVGQPTFA